MPVLVPRLKLSQLLLERLSALLCSQQLFPAPIQFFATMVVGLDVQLRTASAPGVKELASLDLH